MSLSQDSFDFLDAKHGLVKPATTPELPIVVAQFMGVNGESHLVGEPMGQDLYCDITADGYATKADLDDDLDIMRTKIGKLTGTLVEVHGASTRNWAQCTFLGFQIYPESPFLDGSGVNGWVAKIRLLWRQRKVT
jgi:hypothetical protein